VHGAANAYVQGAPASGAQARVHRDDD